MGDPATAPGLERRVTEVAYGIWDDAWPEHGRLVRQLIDRHAVIRICDVGGGAHPILPADYVVRRGLEYRVLDISAEELRKAAHGYASIVADICARDFRVDERFDLVCSKMLAEHVRDPETFHRNVYGMLEPGGIAFHFFPTLYAAPFVINRLVPERLAGWLQGIFAPRNAVSHAKFPAYYAWCRGPTSHQLTRFRQVGYDVLLYKGFFGHGYYDRIPLVRTVHRAFSKFLVSVPVPGLTSYAFVVLRKPGTSDGAA
jgi:2-polyprenyl-3-methyl-5-hydroxy-6-metoxy-1,4-benzoquinol methylase